MADNDHHVSHAQLFSPIHCGHAPQIRSHEDYDPAAQQYSGFKFSTPQVVMGPGTFDVSIPQGSMTPESQPLLMPKWPSMLRSQFHCTFQPAYLPPVQPIGPATQSASQTPVSATLTRSTKAPRKTLTDVDRKRMCQYDAEHPKSKQTDIAAIFGVDRSTVSKVLRNKDKYLARDEESHSPIKRARERSPDLERALVVWAKKRERSGLTLTNDMIREKAWEFSVAAASPKTQTAPNMSWIESFKLENNLMGAGTSKSSFACDDSGAVSPRPTLYMTSADSSIPHEDILPSELHSTQSQESPESESLHSSHDFSKHGVHQSQIKTPLNSAVAETNGSPLEATQDFLIGIDEVVRPSQLDRGSHTITPTDAKQLPPLPVCVSAAQTSTGFALATSTNSGHHSTSPKEAQQALQVVMRFIEQRGSTFLSFQESIHLGMLVEKLELSARSYDSSPRERDP